MTLHPSNLSDPPQPPAVPLHWATRSLRAIWMALVLLGALAIAVAGWRILGDVAPLALSGESHLAEIRDASMAEIDASDSEALSRVQAKVAGIQSQAQPAARTMRWLARFPPAVSWLPSLDYEITAWSAQASRLEGGLDSTSALVSTSFQLMHAYGQAQAVLISSPSQRPSPLLATQAREMEGTFSTAIEQAGKAVRAGRGYVNRCVNDIRRRPSQPLSQRRFHTRIERRDRRLRSTQGPSDA